MTETDFDKSKRMFLRQCLAISTGMYCIPAISFFEDIPAEGQQGIYKKAAMFQEETPGGIMCRLCPNECIMKEGETSRCRARRVKDSKLFTLSYGNPCAANIDPVEKKPLYHFFPGSRAYSIATAGCNLMCLNCQNWTISQASPDKTRNFDLVPEKVVEEAEKNGCISIAYTYSEPTTFYEYTYDTSVLARKKGIRNIVKSNGYINPEPLKKLCEVIDAANIDLKAFNNNTYLRLTGGKLQPVLDTLKIYRDNGVWLEITNLIIPTWSDSPEEIRSMCKWLSDNGFKETPLHFSRFQPLYKLEQLPPTPLEVLVKAAKIASEEGLKYIYIGNVPGNESANTICPKCGSQLITRQGFRVVSDNISGGKCKKCGNVISGVWS